MSKRASLVEALAHLDRILERPLPELPHPPELIDLLEWELADFAPKVGRIEESSTYKVQTVYGSVKRPKSGRYDSDSRDESAQAPPASATLLLSSRRETTRPSTQQRHSTRQTTTFDRHLREDLILRRTAVVPSMADDLAELCAAVLAANPTRPWAESCDFSAIRRTARELSTVHVSAEDQIRDFYEYRQNAALHLFSTAMSTDGGWPESVARGHSLLYWTKGNDPDQTKALPDAAVHVDPDYLASNDGKVRDDLAAALQEVINQDLSPIALWEFKDIVCATIEVMVAIREICLSTGVYQWISCRDRPQCKSGCVDPKTAQYKVSGRLAWLDAPVVEEFLCQAAARKDITLFDFEVDPKASDRSAARCIIQQLWGELTSMEGTVAVIQGGNYEMIAVRHRATQTLFLSDIQVTHGKRHPAHVKLHTGLTSLMTADAIQRAKLAKVAKAMDETLLPSRMRNPSDFNVTAWRGKWNIDTKKTAQQEASRRPARSEKWSRGDDEFRNEIMRSRRVRLRFSGTIAAGYTHMNLEPGNVLHLQNVTCPISVSADGTRSFVDSSPSDVGIVVLPGNNRDHHNAAHDFLICNMASTFDNDDHYSYRFVGMIARHRDDVQRLINQYNVHQALEQLGTTAAKHVQRHLGLFLTRDHDFGILFLETIDPKSFVPLSSPSAPHSNVVHDLAESIQEFFDALPLAHRSLEARKIMVRTNGASTPEVGIVHFYVTGWRDGKVWGDVVSDAERCEKERELAADKARLKGILTVLQ